MPDPLQNDGAGPPPGGRAGAMRRERRELVSLMAARVRDAGLRQPYFVDGSTDLVTLCRALADVYARIPQLPVTPETMDEATDALEAFCHVLGVHGVEVD